MASYNTPSADLEKEISDRFLENIVTRRSTLPHRPRDISFENLVFSVITNRRKKEQKQVLRGVSGRLNSGELVALMGPSGAGKTTLMNVLAGYKIKNIGGKVKVDGKDRDLNKFRKLSCYIMQYDELLPQLSVMECMIVAANLKVPKASFDKKLEMVNEILSDLGLTKCKNTKTSMLSGGERKRLAIAQELVNNPPVMFLDEPTSGLDSQASFQCISVLKKLACSEDGNRRIIVCTIHQPSAKLFELFDKLYVLANGACVYKGSITALVPYLKSQGLYCPKYHNSADYVIEVASGEHGNVTSNLAQKVTSGNCDKFVKAYDKAQCQKVLLDGINKNKRRSRLRLERLTEVEGKTPSSGEKVIVYRKLSFATNKAMATLKDVEEETVEILIAPAESQNEQVTGCCAMKDWRVFAAVPFFNKFSILFLRTFKCIIRDQNLTLLRLISHVVVGLLIGLLYYRVGNDATKTFDNRACLFLSLLFIMFTSLMPTVMTFPLELAVFIREHLNQRYSLTTYYFAKTIADLPFQIIFPFVYSCIVYFMTDQPWDAVHLLLFSLFSTLVTLTAQSLGLLIGAAAPIQVAVFLGPVTAIPILLFSGFFIKVDEIPVYLRWISYGSYVRFAYEGTLLSIYGFDRDNLTVPANVTAPHSSFIFQDPRAILESEDLAGGKWWMDMLILLIFFTVFRVVAFLVLLWRIRSQR